MNKIQIRNLTILLGSTMTVMAGATLAPALPEIHLAFQDVPNVDVLVRLVVTLPALLIAIAAPFTGYLLDHWGRKPVLIVAMALYGVAGTSGYLLESLYGILIGRAFLGVAVAGVMIGFTTLIADYFKGNQLNKFMGSQAAFIGFGGVVFVTAGGFLADIGWRFPFLVHLFAFVILLGVLFVIDEPHIQDSSTSQSTSGEQISFSLKNVALIYGIGIIAMVVFFMVPVQLPFYLTDLIDASTSQIGLALAAQALSAAIVSTQYQKIKERFSFQTISSLVFLTIGAGYFIIGMSATYGQIK